MNTQEFTCEICGTLVVQMIPEPESTMCAQCRFLEGIEDPKHKAEMTAHLNEKDQLAYIDAKNKEAEQKRKAAERMAERIKPCCNNMRRNMNGGCDNCGDPCL